MTADEMVEWAKSHGWKIAESSSQHIIAFRPVKWTARGTVLDGNKKRWHIIMWQRGADDVWRVKSKRYVRNNPELMT
jgi:hypothetical protein